MSQKIEIVASHDDDLNDEALDRSGDSHIKVSTSCITCRLDRS